MLSGSADKTQKLWDAATGRLLRTFEGHSHGVGRTAFSPDGRNVLSGSQATTVKLWDAATGKLLQTLEGLAFSPVARSTVATVIAFSADGRSAVLTDDKVLKLWDTATRQLLRTFEGHSVQVDAVAFSPDGRTVISGGSDGSGAKLVGIGSGVISGLNSTSQIRRLAAAEGDNANDDRYSKLAGW